MRASKLIGTNVKNQANETIGEINELILDKDGKVAAVVIGVGGFLGIGQREVALDYKSLNIKYDPNAMTDAGATTVMVNATKESLQGCSGVDVEPRQQYRRHDHRAADGPNPRRDDALSIRAVRCQIAPPSHDSDLFIRSCTRAVSKSQRANLVFTCANERRAGRRSVVATKRGGNPAMKRASSKGQAAEKKYRVEERVDRTRKRQIESERPDRGVAGPKDKDFQRKH